jgi:hypothetical protein
MTYDLKINFYPNNTIGNKHFRNFAISPKGGSKHIFASCDFEHIYCSLTLFHLTVLVR